MIQYRLSLRVLGVALLTLVAAQPAVAHSEVVQSEPAAGSTVATAPQEVRVEFSQLLDPAESSITVVDGAGTTVSQGQSEVLANDNKVMRVALQPNLVPGMYTVRWENLSAEDGEADSGDFTFSVGTGAGQPQAGSADGQVPPAQLPATGVEASRTVAWLLIALALFCSGVILRSVGGFHLRQDRLTVAPERNDRATQKERS